MFAGGKVLKAPETEVVFWASTRWKRETCYCIPRKRSFNPQYTDYGPIREKKVWMRTASLGGM